MDKSINSESLIEYGYKLLYPNGDTKATLLFNNVTGELLLLKGSIIKSNVSKQFEKLCGGILNNMRKEFIVEHCDRCPDSEDYIMIEHAKVSDFQQAEIIVMGNNETLGKCWSEKVNRPSKIEVQSTKENIQSKACTLPIISNDLFAQEPTIVTKSDTGPLYYLTVSGSNCKMHLVNENDPKGECVVLAGSILSLKEKDSFKKAYLPLRNNVIHHYCDATSLGYKLKNDYRFKTINQAAVVSTGIPINARVAWKDEQGRTIKEIFGDKQ